MLRPAVLPSFRDSKTAFFSDSIARIMELFAPSFDMAADWIGADSCNRPLRLEGPNRIHADALHVGTSFPNPASAMVTILFRVFQHVRVDTSRARRRPSRRL